MNTEKGLILIAHGSRVKKTAEEMNSLVSKLQTKLSDRLVREAYMEIQDPNLSDTITEMVDLKINEIAILPLFFFEGRHMRDDIPAQVEECKEKFPQCKINLLPYIGSTESFANSLVESVLTL